MANTGAAPDANRAIVWPSPVSSFTFHARLVVNDPMSTETFPTSVLIPSSGFISRRGDVFDIWIGIQPFELDSETVSTDLRFEGAELPLDGPSAWQRQTFTFPANPEPGYIDGSIYIRGSHNPADLTRIGFGEHRGSSIDAILSISIVFEYEGVGFSNADVTLNVPLEIRNA